MVTNRATSHDEAEEWDLEYWQSMTAEERLSALVAIRRDVELAQQSRRDVVRTFEGDDSGNDL